MTYLAGLAAVLVFAVVLDRSGIPGLAAEAINLSRKSTGTLRDRSLSDEEKERALRTASTSLARSFLSIGARSLLAVGLSLATILAFEVVGLADFSAVVDWLATAQAILLASGVLLIWFLLRRF